MVNYRYIEFFFIILFLFIAAFELMQVHPGKYANLSIFFIRFIFSSVKTYFRNCIG